MASTTLVYEIHEDRIRNLEDSMTELNANLARLSTQQEHISNTLETVKEDMESRMQEGFDIVTVEVRKTGDKIDKLHKVVESHDKRIQGIESVNEASARRWSLVWKVLFAVVAAVGGAVANEWAKGFLH
jgi:flagellar biosynthesis chaperone FliJ